MFDEFSGQIVGSQKIRETDALPSFYAKSGDADGWHTGNELPAGLHSQKTLGSGGSLIDDLSSAQTLKMTGADDLPTDNAHVFADIMEHETGSGVKTQTGEYERENALVPTHSQTSSNNRLKKLTSDIKENGILEPIKYIEYNGEKHVVDGHHRLLAAKRLGLTEVPAVEVTLPYAGYRTLEDLLWFD